jgi:hypothetical protein
MGILTLLTGERSKFEPNKHAGVRRTNPAAMRPVGLELTT